MSSIPETRTTDLSVMRNVDFGDASRGGITDRHSRLALVGWTTGNGRWPAEVPTLPKRTIRGDEAPVILEHRDLWMAGQSVWLVPATWNDDTEGWEAVRGTMFGGNYAATSDARFGELIAELLGHPFYGAVAVHDRIED